MTGGRGNPNRKRTIVHLPFAQSPTSDLGIRALLESFLAPTAPTSTLNTLIRKLLIPFAKVWCGLSRRPQSREQPTTTAL